jgi:hypothetical protein
MQWDTDEHGSGRILTDQTKGLVFCLIRVDP